MSWQHLRDETPAARKPHRCFLCGAEIRVGERHVKRAGISDGGLDTFRMHAACEAETKDWDETDWECFSEGDMERPTPTVTPNKTAPSNP